MHFSRFASMRPVTHYHMPDRLQVAVIAIAFIFLFGIMIAAGIGVL